LANSGNIVCFIFISVQQY